MIFYLAAVPAVVLLGLAKGGLSGLGNLAVPIMVLAMSPLDAVAILLPVLIIQDAVSVGFYRKVWDARNLLILIPAAAGGIVLGYVFAAYVADAAIGLAVGIISVAFGVRRLVVERQPDAISQPGKTLPGVVWGMISGFTSMIAHAGGPPFQIYVMPQRLPHTVFIGTSVLFFAAVNLMKVAPYLLLGQLTQEHLIRSATLIPVAILSTWLGVRIAARLSGKVFYTIVYLLMIAVGVRLIWSNLSIIS